MASVWGELKRRNVVRVAIAYAIVAWLLIEVSATIFPLLNLPAWGATFVTVLLMIGFPVALLFAWAFELTPEGLKKEKDVSRSDSITHITGRRLDFVIIVVLVVAVGFLLVDKLYLTEGDTVAGEIVATERQSIAVLPFVNMSADPEQEFFSDGLSEEILNLLAKIPELKVIGRTSSFAFKGKNEDLRVIGEALGVKTVLEGSVRRSGERLRVTAQLIDVSDGAHIWSETYDRTLTDIFEIQDSVAGEIIDALKVHVGVVPLRGQPTDNIEAYSLLLQARALQNEYQFLEAIPLLQRAVKLDPDFAEAYELLAYAHWSMAGTYMKSAEGQRLAGAAARKALEIDPDLVLAQSLAVSGDIDNYSYLREIEGLERAAILQPANTSSLDMLVYDLLEAGYLSEGLDLAQRYVDSDPLSAAAHLRLSHALLAVGRQDEAWNEMEVSAELSTELEALLLAMRYAADGRDEEAISHLADWFEQSNVPASMARDFVIEGRRSDSGAAFLDVKIAEIVGLVPDQLKNNVHRILNWYYAVFGHLDRFYEIILNSDINSSTWTEADDLIFSGTVFRSNGFTAHPKYLVAAELMGLVELWEQRGPPDFCNKTNGKWICD